jgi:fructose-1,6-bisphosphatase/sedoheptulose 1,7-bisphosphatase-like protein
VTRSAKDLGPDVAALDSRISDVILTPVSAPKGGRQAPRPAVAALVAAMASAARGAAEAIGSPAVTSLSLEERKKAIDGAATAAAEQVFDHAALDIRVVAGEGERDESPGATVGQHLGTTATTTLRLDGVFDYVDGTALAAAGLPGALALGSFGEGISVVPDLQAYCVLGPAKILDRLDIMSSPESHAMGALATIAAASAKGVADLVVYTHAAGKRPMHATLIERIRPAVATVVTQEVVTVEPPHLLSLAGLSQPRIDTMIGAIGLSELVFAATLLDLVNPDYGFVFRVASIAGPRRKPDNITLDALFDFTPAEIESYEQAGWDTDRQYSNADLLAPGSAVCACVFAVTRNDVLDLPAPSLDTHDVTTTGLLLEPGGRTTRVTVHYRG